MTSNLNPNFSPAPWAYEYNPYIAHDGRDIPAFEVFDDNGNRVFMTEEDQPVELQEANARLGAVAPRLLAALDQLLTIFDEEIAQGILLEDPRIAEARCAIAEATCSSDDNPMSDEILDDLFHGCAFVAYLDQAAEDGTWPPDSEATRQRAYRYYEEALAEKNKAFDLEAQSMLSSTRK